jgi:hypothetical protein
MPTVPIAKSLSQSCLTGPHFYSANLVVTYWDYDSIATVYKGFSLKDIKTMTVRQRSYWSAMSKWRKQES